MHGLFSSESVAAGHPDKLCDRISDAVLDFFLALDVNSRVACETATGPGWVRVFGEYRTSGGVTTDEVENVVRGAIRRAGFRHERDGLDPARCEVQIHLVPQSPEIAAGVDRSLERRMGSNAELDGLGAGDQGIMFGYACSETPELMPLSLMLAHRMAGRLPLLDWSGPDGKTQVTVRYENGVPVEVDSVLVSVQHRGGTPAKMIDRDVRAEVIDPVLRAYGVETPGRALINPSGSFVLGGPAADAGLTGRKIIVDTYGGAARHGGGAFSGKDPSKVDRSAAYALRQVAKAIVGAGLASRAEVQAAYAIGVAEPVSLMVETFGTGVVSEATIADAVQRTVDLRPLAIVHRLGLRDRKRRPLYEATSSGGHFGRAGMPWEEYSLMAENLAHAVGVPA